MDVSEKMKTRVLTISVIAIIIAGFSTILLVDNDMFSENNTIMKSDAEILDEINRQASIHKNNDNQEKFHEYVILMEEKIRQIASDSLGMHIISASVGLPDPETGIESNNFPFRNSSEINIPEGREPFPICNISEKIPVHLKKFLNEPLFAMFSKKYSQHDTELLVMDERYQNSLVHYAIDVKSKDGLSAASNTFHVNTCTDEIQEDFPILVCRNIETNEFHQSFNQDDIQVGLQLEEFCTIPLDSWRQSIHEYGNTVQEKIQEQSDVPIGTDNYEELQEIWWDERVRLDSLRAITILIVNDGLESEIVQKKIGEYNGRFGSLPDDLLELMEEKN